MHEELLAALSACPGLVLVTGPTGHGKTTAIEQVLADPRCPPDVVFIGDMRGEPEDAARVLQLARSQVVVAVLRIPRAAGAFSRLRSVGVPAAEMAEVVRAVFSTRLVRSPGSGAVLLHEHLMMTDAVRDLVSRGEDEQAIHRQAVADGMIPIDESSPAPHSEPARILYRPVGPKELALIAASGYREFPPRLPEQPIFYPVTNEEYARHIAEQWNVKESGSGYVTRFAVREECIVRYPEQQVGARLHTEYWIPAEELAEMNRNIVGLIEVIGSYEPDCPGLRGLRAPAE